MRKFRAKMRRIKATRWHKLTLGEKVLAIVMGLIKWGLIAAVVFAVVSFIAVAVVAVVIGLAAGNAIAEGFGNASRAYRPGEHYVRW